MSENTQKVTTRKVNKPKADEKIKVIIEPRFEEDLGKRQQFFGLGKYTATVTFGEEVELESDLIENIKSKGRYVSYVKDGEMIKKWNKRFIVEKV